MVRTKSIKPSSGLIDVASGRVMLPEMNAPDYLKQVRVYGGFWARLALLMEAEPTISERIRALLEAGLLKAELRSCREDPC